MNIYVGNLPYTTQESDITEMFQQYGEVYSVKLIKDFDTGKLKGFGFVEMEQNGGNEAINGLNDKEFGDRKIIVNEAKQRKERDSRGGGGGNRYNGGNNSKRRY
jgi:RNA recognition motif-containing protein